jgi:hypothetical protein
MIKKLLALMGLGGGNSIAGLRGIVGADKTRLSPTAQERMRFEEDVKEQFMQLKKKGLSIPVFTL